MEKVEKDQIDILLKGIKDAISEIDDVNEVLRKIILKASVLIEKYIPDNETVLSYLKQGLIERRKELLNLIKDNSKSLENMYPNCEGIQKTSKEIIDTLEGK